MQQFAVPNISHLPFDLHRSERNVTGCKDVPYINQSGTTESSYTFAHGILVQSFGILPNILQPVCVML